MKNLWFVQPLLKKRFQKLGKPLFTDLDHKGVHSNKISSQLGLLKMTHFYNFFGLFVNFMK